MVDTNKKTTLKEVFESNDWIITKLCYIGSKRIRVDARRRYRIPDKPMFFSEWGSREYLNRLSLENFNKAITELNCTKHY